MFPFSISTLAQAAPAAEQVTTGQILASMLALGVIAASVAMIVAWVVRLGQTGHALPAAQRGILRVPLPLTIVAIALSLFMILLTALAATEAPLPPPVAASPAGAAVDAESDKPANQTGLKQPASSPSDSAVNPTDESDAQIPDTTDLTAGPNETTPDATETEEPVADPGDAEDTQKAAKPLTPEDMQSRLIDVIAMDLFLCLVLGFVIFVVSHNGRVRIGETFTRVWAPAARSVRSAFGGDSFWPDLNDGSAIPQLPGYSLLGERTPPQSVAEPAVPEPPHWISPLESAPQDEAPGVTEPDEPFSFLTELRYAGEVFLAAYAPTAVLRILIVLLTVGLVGEEPESHPFLEMMTTGVGVKVLALILMTAVILAPLVEELQFRVIVLGGLAQLGYPMLGLCISSILFAFAHGFPDSLALVPLAVALGYTYLRRRSYITVMMVHFLFNGFNMVLALLAMI